MIKFYFPHVKRQSGSLPTSQAGLSIGYLFMHVNLQNPNETSSHPAIAETLIPSQQQSHKGQQRARAQ